MERSGTYSPVVVIFGAAEHGPLREGVLCKTAQELYSTYGNPPDDSVGILYALQAILFQRKTLFFRVDEEGVSSNDYFYGFETLRSSLVSLSEPLSALCLPGVGSIEIVERGSSICELFHGFLVLRPEDLYDLLTDRRAFF